MIAMSGAFAQSAKQTHKLRKRHASDTFYLASRGWPAK
jgi:hypothetical protein